jgi:MinD superfamily P-loop ATPase
LGADFVVDEIGCEGCGVCVDFCPEQAIDFPVKTCGQWFISDTRFGPMVHARLGIAEENSGNWWRWCASRPGNWPKREALT